MNRCLSIAQPRSLCALLGVLFLLPCGVRATLVVLPSNPGWTGGAPAPGTTASQSFTVTNPNDMTISIQNNAPNSTTGLTWASGYPAINSTGTTGGFTSVNGLQLYGTATSSTSAYIMTTVTFTSAVTNLSFQVWDVDKSAGQFVDKISGIQALGSNGVTQGASSISSAVAGYNTITGSGLTAVITGTNASSNTTNQGTINISFSGPITQFSFLWSNADAGLGAQAIGLGQINFTPIPEINPGWAAVVACCFGAGRVFLRRRRTAEV